MPKPTILAAVAGYGLPGTPPLPSEALDDDVFAGLLGDAERHRLVGLMGAAARAGDLPVTPDQRKGLEDVLQGWLAHGLRLERLVLEVLDCLVGAAIESRVLKGVALAHTVYPGPSWRVFGDVDVLVAAPEFGAAVPLLEERFGVSRRVPELHAGFDARFGKASLLRIRDLELDVHRTLVRGAFGLRVDLENLRAGSRPFELAGQTVRTLAPPQQLVHACYTAALGDSPPRLSALRDVAQVLEALSPDPDDVLRVAKRWQGEAVVARAVTGAYDALALRASTPLVDWARRYRPSPLDRALLASYQGMARGRMSRVGGVVAIPGISDKLAYLRAMAFPQPAYLRARGTTRVGYASRAFRRPGRLGSLGTVRSDVTARTVP